MRANGAIEGAAEGFEEGDEVIVLKKYDGSSIKVIGHIDGIRRCEEEEDLSGNYYTFFTESGVRKVANASYADGVFSLGASMIFDDLGISGPTNLPIRFHVKKFYQDGKTLYYVATSLYLNLSPFLGWDDFVSANPAHPLVTNTQNTQITMTTQLMADLESVNSMVNNEHEYTEDFGNEWKFLGEGEAGDCEDFSLTKAQMLLDMGYPASALHIECGVLENSTSTGHAWLVVQTTTGDYALDIHRGVVLNSSVTASGQRLILRKRQTGAKWACVSMFSWLHLAQLIGGEYSNYDYLYIFDPELNMFHRLGQIDGTVYRFMTNFGIYWDYLPQTIVNFSNTHCFLLFYGSKNTQILKYKLINNDLVLISTTSIPNPADESGYLHYLNTNGEIVSHIRYDQSTKETRIQYYPLSLDGYFGFVLSPPGSSVKVGYSLLHLFGRTVPYSEIIGTSSDGQISSILSPWGEELFEYLSGATLLGVFQPFSFVDTGSLLIQGFSHPESTPLELCRIYQNDVSIVNQVASISGVTETDLIGFTFVPFTDQPNIP